MDGGPFQEVGEVKTIFIILRHCLPFHYIDIPTGGIKSIMGKTVDALA